MKLKLLDSKTLTDFPSGSAIEYYDDHIYLVGDDASQMLILTKRWNEVQRVNLFESETLRAAKEVKADLESMALVSQNDLPHILILGSGSYQDYRNKAYLFSLETSEVTEIDLSVFYNRLADHGITELNIEATTAVKDKIVFCNRANLTNTDNQFIITDPEFWLNQEEAEIVVLPLNVEEENWHAGVSGLAYSEKNDWLIFTASTEATANAFDDGEIGDSYVGVIENASRKIGRKKLKVNALINLTDEHENFKGHKIESVCVQKEGSDRVRLHLAADNDNGQTALFKVRLKS